MQHRRVSPGDVHGEANGSEREITRGHLSLSRDKIVGDPSLFETRKIGTLVKVEDGDSFKYVLDEAIDLGFPPVGRDVLVK